MNNRTKEAVGRHEEDLVAVAAASIPYTTVFRNVYIPCKGGRTTEIDVLLINPKGLFALEVKGFGGAIFGSTTRYEWTRAYRPPGSKSVEKTKFYNPVRQSNTHLEKLSQYLNVPISVCTGIVVFSNRAILKKVPANTKTCLIMQTSELQTTLPKRIRSRRDRLSPADIRRIENLLEGTPHINKKLKQKHVSSVKRAEKFRKAVQEKRRRWRSKTK